MQYTLIPRTLKKQQYLTELRVIAQNINKQESYKILNFVRQKLSYKSISDIYFASCMVLIFFSQMKLQKNPAINLSTAISTINM